MHHNLYKIYYYLEKTLTKEILFDLYWNQNKSICEIARIFKIHNTTIFKKLKKFGIRIKSRWEARGGRPTFIKWRKILTREFLIKEYIDKEKNMLCIAKEQGTVHSIVQKYLKEYCISIRSRSECQKGIQIGKKHWNWCGGLKDGHTSFFLRTRYKIRKRDNYICQCCGITEEEHYEKFNKNLLVHHIDFNKLNDDEKNLITLCRSCHSKINGDLDYWFAYFQYKIEEFYK